MISAKESSKIKVECYSVPLRGHATPLLKVIEILLTTPSKFSYDITYMSSKFFVDKIKDQYKHINMLAIQDGVTEKQHKQAFGLLGHKIFLMKYNLNLHKNFFQQKSNHPDLIICDFFSQECIRYARKHNIKYIINSPSPYGWMKDVYGFPSFRRSIAIAGFTIICPVFLNPFPTLGFTNLPNASRYNNRILFNSVIGLQHAVTMPSNHTFTGFIRGAQRKRQPIDEDLLKWIKNWKAKGKNKFIYISFGTIIELGQSFALTLKKAIETSQYPTIWSLRGAFVDNFSSEYIYHRKWMPQQAILALEEVKCYMTHCGWGSITQAVTHEVPMVCVPSFGDQPHDAQLVTQKKIGIQIYKPNLFKTMLPFNPDIQVEKIIKTFSTIIQDQSYQKNISKISAISRSYNAPRIYIQAVENTIQFGYEHLIDQKFQQCTTQTQEKTWKVVKWAIAIFVLSIIYYVCSILGFF